MQEKPTIELVPADKVSLGQRVTLMNTAYADYLVPVRVSAEQMATMDALYDIDPARSVVARTRWESIGMALLAVRGDQSWVSGVGVVPEWRRQGVGRLMMERLIEIARTAGASTAVLEVISQNAAARRLYASLGFVEARELLTWRRPSNADPLPVPLEHLVPVEPEDLIDTPEDWYDQPACWQRSHATLANMLPRLRGYRLNWKGEAAASCLLVPGDESVSLMDVAINPDSGLLMPGRLLLQALATLHFGRSFTIMNVPADDMLNRIFAALGFLVTLRQIEMVLDLSPAA